MIPPLQVSGAPSVGSGFQFGKSVENAASSSETMTVFDNPDGTHTAELSAAPLRFRDRAKGGAWSDIDSTLISDPTRPGWLRSKANAWVVRFGPTPSLELNSASGGVQTMTPVGGAAVAPVVSADKTSVTYPGVWTNVDLRYIVSSTGVEEDIVVNGPPGRSSFDFTTGTTSYSAAANGGMTPEGASADAMAMIPPTVLDATGTPVVGASPSLTPITTPSGPGVRVSVSPSWTPSYPYVIDPSYGNGSSNITAYESNNVGTQIYSCACAARIGNSQASGDTYWRSVGYFNMTSLAGDAVSAATVELDNRAAGTANAYNLGVYQASAYSWAGAPAWGPYVAVQTTNGGSYNSPGIAKLYNSWSQTRQSGGAIGFAGQESPGLYTYKQFNNYLIWLTYWTFPTAPAPTGPGATGHNLTPVLSASSSNKDGTALQYYFQVATDSGFSNIIDTSGWIGSSSWQVPSGLLGWNSTYYWRAYAWDGQYDAAGNPVMSGAGASSSYEPVNSAPSSPGLVSPGSATTQVISTSTTSFNTNTSVDPDGDTVSYRFQIATGADGQTGRLITSGWQSGTSWSPPPGTFQDGGVYYWTAQAEDPYGFASPWSQPLPFRVDFRMGQDSRLPYDTEGPVSVNLSNGNAVVTAAGPNFTTVGGPVGVSFNYNSMASVNYGLTGRYYQDPRGVGVIQANSGQLLELTRQDTSLDFNWASDGATDGPAPGTVLPDHWLAEWKGYITTPGSDQYALVATRVDDTIKATITDSSGTSHQALSANYTNQPQTGGYTFSGVNLPITVDYSQATGPEYLDVQIKDVTTNGAPFDIPANWLTPTAAALPDGWSRTGNSFAAGYSALRSQSATSVAVVDDTGAQHLFTSTGGTGWVPPPGEDSTLTKNSDGTWTLIGDDGSAYSFDASGQLTKVTSAADDLHPGAPSYNYGLLSDGVTSRLFSIVDATGRTMTLQYYGQTGATCPTASGFDNNLAVDVDMLCRVSYTDQGTTPGFGGGETDLYYSNGHLARITNPGGGTAGTPTTDFAYSNITVNTQPVSLLTGIRDELTNDLIANTIITDPTNLAHFTQIGYDTSGRVTSVTLPEPDASGTNIPSHSYAYPSSGSTGGTTNVSVAGESTSQGWAHQVTYDAGGHATTDIGADGIATNYTWDDLNDRLLATIDHHYQADPAHGLETTSIYDAAGNVTDTYGPAPATSFTANYTSTTAPHATSAYDQDLNGLAGAWYEGANPAGTAAFHNTDTVNDSWGSGSPSTGSTTPNAIAPASATTPFSGVLTGQATLNQPGRLQLTADGAQVWVDDHQVVSAWGGPYAAAVNTDGPVDWWRLADPAGSASATDQTSGDPGTYVSGATPGAPGQHQGDSATSTAFNGTSGYVNIPTPTGSTAQAGFQWLGSSPFSIDAWIDPTGTPAGQHYARILDFGTGPATNNVVFDLGPDGNDLNLTIDNNGTSQAINVANAVTYNTWQHVAATFNPNGAGGGTATLYVNGNQIGTQNFTITPAAVNYTTNYIGRSEWTGDPYFAGNIQDVALYQTALPTARLAAHFQAGGQTQTTTTTPVIWNTPYPKAVVNDTPAGFWRLGDPAGSTTSTDSYGTNNGTYANVTLASAGADTNDPSATSAVFNGTNSTVSINDNPALNPRAFSVEAWVKTTSSGTYQTILSKMANASPYTGWELDLTPQGQPMLMIINNWSANAIDIATTSATNVADGQWHQVAVSYNGTNASGVSFYVDGHMVAANTAGALNSLNGSFANTQPAYIGSRANSADFFNGSIQDVSLYDQALAGPTIAAHYAAASATAAAFANVHRIRIQVQQLVAGGQLQVTLPTGASLQPRYGLETSHSDADGDTTATSYTNTAGITPAYGLATSSTVDPSGLNLATTTGYETIGTGYLRQTSRTLPAGGQTTYAYYSQGPNPSIATNPCPGGAVNIPQGGAQWTSTDASGTVTEVVHDEAGRTVASRIQSDGANWTCTTYDTRGRTATVAYPALYGQAARTVNYNYAVTDNTLNGSPANPAVTAVTDTGATCTFNATGGTAGCVTTKVDWLGRAVSYTDTWGDTTATTYDQAGRVTQTAGPAGTQTTSYDNADRPANETLDGGVIATATYDPNSGLATSYTYPTGTGDTGNGTTQTVTYDTNGRTASLGYTNNANQTITTDAITSRTAAGRVTGETIDGTALNPSGPAFSYDNAGRLTDAYAPGHHYTYTFAPTTGCAANNAGLDSNRTSYTDNGVTKATYCYNQADQLQSTTDTTFTGTTTCPGGGTSQFCYDIHGNTTTMGNQTISYDAADRQTGLTTPTSTVTYQRDPTDRITERDETTGGTTTAVRYGYSGDGDTADFTLNTNNTITERDIQLLGGVTVTKRGSTATDVWSYPNIHGDNAATADGNGNKTGNTYLYDPFGNALGGEPDNSAGDLKYGWEGKAEKGTDTTPGAIPTIEMGVRLYVPSLGRFLQTDPVEGGNANAYIYPQDPVNGSDLTGMCFVCHIWHGIRRAGRWVARNSGTLSTIAGAVSLAAWAACPATGFSCGLAVGLDYASTSFAGMNAAYRCSGRRRGCSGALASLGASVAISGAARFAARGMRSAMTARTNFAYSRARYLERQAVTVGIASNGIGLGYSAHGMARW